jgi:hypothetical protein
MKKNTLGKLAWSLDHLQYEVDLEEEVRAKAELSLRRMLELSGGWKRKLTPEEEKFEASVAGASGCGCG